MAKYDSLVQRLERTTGADGADARTAATIIKHLTERIRLYNSDDTLFDDEKK